MATGSLDRKVRVWDAATGKLVTTTPEHSDFVRLVAFHPRRALLAAVSGREARLWDAATGKPVGEAMLTPGFTVWCLAFPASGSSLVTGSNDGDIRWWAVPAGTLTRVFPVHPTGSVRSRRL